jgi:two-component system chemotaxis sensor kinase CheA
LRPGSLSAAFDTGIKLKRLPIRLKLILLAGVPVVGALMLATLIVRDARRQAESAAALGSIEDLARLSAQMSGLVHELQFERNELSLRLAQKTLAEPALQARFAKTDAARKQLSDFLGGRKVSSLPPRLARDLKRAQAKLDGLAAERDAATAGHRQLHELLDYYEETDLSLISATAALSQLSNDGELLRAISALVTVLQIKERASQEHALLSHVFTVNEFPAGAYKELVTLTTEEADYANVLKVNATDSVNERYSFVIQGPEFTRTSALRKIALDTLNDDFQVKPLEWSEAQASKIELYRALEVGLNDAVKSAALAKVAAATHSVRLSYGLGAGVVVVSALLAWLIARGVSRSVASLSHAAELVRRDKDFGVRAQKTSDDELGALTDVFNEMLSGIQGRDEELRQHRENLEQLVEQRTLALQKRNEAMRLVLDNVEQGLATIEPDGRLAGERSRAFDDWFGGREANDSFADQIGRRDDNVRATLKMAWEQVVDGFLPLDAAIEQLPRQIQVEGRHYNLKYKAIVEQENLHGALLVVSDVTLETEQMQRDAEQRELLSAFEHVMRDRAGFIQFFRECEALVANVVGGEITDPQVAKRAVHTIKGNCGMFGITSISDVAHQLESALADSGELPSCDRLSLLREAWNRFSERVRRLSVSQEEPVVEVAYEELEALERAAAVRAPHSEIGELLERLKYERGVVCLRRVAEHARGLAERLGKGELDVEVDASNEVRFQAEHWAPFWASFVHVLRNALDHGIEAAADRVAAGKPARGKLELSARADAERLTIEIKDDGRGIDWKRVREKAKDCELPHETEQDLVSALFWDGLSTAEGITEVSGRGVGMSAVREAARALGGTVSVASTPGAGTTIRFCFPLAECTKTSMRSRRPGARPSVAPPPAPHASSRKIAAA